MVREFKAFIMRGNVVDLAVGVIIGAAFGKIVTSLVSDLVMPPIGLALGKVNMSDLFVNLSDKPVKSLVEAKAVGAATINYGVFLNTVIEFLIIAFFVFLIVKAVTRLHPAAVTTRPCPMCAEVIPVVAKRCGHCTSDLTVAKV